jgi:4-amino-4-deoxychorismate lyase
MCLLFESIKVVDGVPRHLELHAGRMQRSRRRLFGSIDAIDLWDVIRPVVHASSGVCKCRVEYDHEIHNVECLPYEQRPISSLLVVNDDRIMYDHKYLDRSAFEKYPAVALTEEILVVRNGLVTDTRYSNVVLCAGHERVTPAGPLLRGVQREHLLSVGAIQARDVPAADIGKFDKVVLINAMMDLETGPMIDVADIRFPVA